MSETAELGDVVKVPIAALVPGFDASMPEGERLRGFARAGMRITSDPSDPIQVYDVNGNRTV